MERVTPSQEPEGGRPCRGWRERLRSPDVVGGLVVLAACALLGWQVLELPRSSAIFPELVLGLGAITAAIMTVQGFRRDAPESQRFFRHPRRFVVATAYIGLYLLGIAAVGFYTSTAILVPLTAVTFGYRKPVAILVATAVFLGVTALLFGYALDYRFPPEFFMTKRGGGHV